MSCISSASESGELMRLRIRTPRRPSRRFIAQLAEEMRRYYGDMYIIEFAVLLADRPKQQPVKT